VNGNHSDERAMLAVALIPYLLRSDPSPQKSRTQRDFLLDLSVEPAKEVGCRFFEDYFEGKHRSEIWLPD
jgi:hypothetical protein